MARGLLVLVLRATLLAISTRVTSALVVGRQSEQIYIGEGLGEDLSRPDQTPSGSSKEIEEVDCQHIANKSAQSYILLGPMDSGTNLLHQLMYAAWPSQVCMNSSGIIWKHALTGAKDMHNFLLTLHDANFWRKKILLHTIRSPISQLASWNHHPYELEKCMSRDVARWGQPCIARMGPDHPDGGSEPTTYSSTMEVYQQYLRQLEEFREAGWFKAVVSVSYEDMILSPKETLTEIAKHFEGLQEVKKARVEGALRKPAKWHASTIDDELAKLAEKAYLRNFSTSGLKTICNGLNRTLLEHYHAGTFLEPSHRVSYWEDCAHV